MAGSLQSIRCCDGQGKQSFTDLRRPYLQGWLAHSGNEQVACADRKRMLQKPLNAKLIANVDGNLLAA